MSDLPHDEQCERWVLSGMFLSPDTVAEVVATGLRADEFYSPRNATLYRTIVAMTERGEVVDATTVYQAWENRAEVIDLLTYVTYLYDSAPGTYAHAYHARFLRRYAILRRLWWAMEAVTGRVAGARASEGPALLADAEAAIQALAMDAIEEEDKSTTDLLREVVRNLEARMDPNATPTGVRTGLADLDAFTLGLQPGELTVLAARPGVGKTALLCNIVDNAVSKSGRPAIFFSLEMPVVAILGRLICARGRINGEHYRQGTTLTPVEVGRIPAALEAIKNLPIRFEGASSPTLPEVAARCRRYRAQAGDLALVALDYLGLVQGDRSLKSREQQVGAVSRGLKVLAKDLDVPVLALAQLNREVEKRSDKRPCLSDLRDSGQVEADADVVILLHRPEEAKGVAEITVAKNRNGRTGKLRLRFFEDCGRFENFAEEKKW